MYQWNLPSGETTFSSRAVNGQLIPVFESDASIGVGNAVGPTVYGYGINTPQTIPLTPGSVSAGASPQAGLLPGLGGSLTMSKAVVLAFMLIIGIAGLRYIHWRG
jgi:hypothetical protein